MDVDIERAHRVERRKKRGSANANEPRTIVCRLRDWKQREQAKIVYKVLGINAPGKASNSSFNTLQLTRNGHKREKKKYRINKRELKNLRKTECTTNRIENTQKFISENITTCNIFTATLRRQQLIYKGEIQNFTKILTK